MENYNLQVFSNYSFGTLSVLMLDNKEYFPATECARILGYNNPKDAIKRHCRWVVKYALPHPQNPNKTIEMNFIPEGDLYRLIIRSKLPSAEQFERWVMDEVLPQLRKTGNYTIIKELQPKAEMCDTFLQSKGYISLNKVAKSLHIGRNKMMAILRENNIIFRDGLDNIPFQRFVDLGYFCVNHKVGYDGLLHSVTKVSPKGVAYIHKLLKKIECEVA